MALKGPTSTPSGTGFRSINIALRRELDLYAGVRPCRALPGVATPFPQTDVVVVRMNHEDLYAGIEYAPRRGRRRHAARDRAPTRAGSSCSPDTGISLKPLSRTGVGAGRASARSSTRAPTGAAR